MTEQLIQMESPFSTTSEFSDSSQEKEDYQQYNLTFESN